MSPEPPVPGRPSDPETPPPARSGVEAGGDLTVGGDVAGRDVIKSTTQNVTNVGVSERTLQRLLITVAAIVFVTAACFFSGGLVVGVTAFNALNRPVTSAEDKAFAFQQKLSLLQSLAPGQTVALTLEEDELSSYVRFIYGEQLGFTPGTGKARLVDGDEIAVAGRVAALNNTLVAATFQLSDVPGQPLELKSVTAQVVPLPNDAFGFGAVALPTALFEPSTAQLNELLGNVQIVDAAVVDPAPDNPVWQLTLVTR